MNFLSFFFNQYSALSSCRGSPSDIYQRFSRRWSGIFLPTQFAYPSPNFWKSVKFSLNFRHHSPLTHLHFKMQQGIWNLKQTSWASMMALCPPHIRCSSVHVSWEPGGESSPTLKLDGMCHISAKMPGLLRLQSVTRRRTLLSCMLCSELEERQVSSSSSNVAAVMALHARLMTLSFVTADTSVTAVHCIRKNDTFSSKQVSNYLAGSVHVPKSACLFVCMSVC